MTETVTHLLCPITLELPVDPVIAEDGNGYERNAIEAQLKVRLKSPLTNKPMGTKLMAAKHVTNVIESLVNAKVDDDRLISWQKQKTNYEKARKVIRIPVKLYAHAFMCQNSSCEFKLEKFSCHETKLILERMALHVKRNNCSPPSGCKICRFIRKLNDLRAEKQQRSRRL